MGAAVISNPSSQYSIAPVFLSVNEDNPGVKQSPVFINSAHAPPLFQGVPLYISYCIYRI